MQEIKVLGINKTLFKYSIINFKSRYLLKKFFLLIVPIKISIFNYSQLFLWYSVANRAYYDIDMNYFSMRTELPKTTISLSTKNTRYNLYSVEESLRWYNIDLTCFLIRFEVTVWQLGKEVCHVIRCSSHWDRSPQNELRDKQTSGMTLALAYMLYYLSTM